MQLPILDRDGSTTHKSWDLEAGKSQWLCRRQWLYNPDSCEDEGCGLAIELDHELDIK